MSEEAARWNTVVAASSKAVSAPGTVTSSTTQSTRAPGGVCWSTATTSQPRRARCAIRFRPTKPAAPVTTALTAPPRPRPGSDRPIPAPSSTSPPRSRNPGREAQPVRLPTEHAARGLYRIRAPRVLRGEDLEAERLGNFVDVLHMGNAEEKVEAVAPGHQRRPGDADL